ncbi:hypothetical protein C0J52_22503 [Blattella germanica]|nr:hypothetical protein C0J52_22503 [Blattella germanica]
MGKRSGGNGGVVINKASTAGLEAFALAPWQIRTSVLSAGAGWLTANGAENIGKAVVELVRFAPSGTIWTLEGSVLARIDVPPSKSYLHLIKTFHK